MAEPQRRPGPATEGVSIDPAAVNASFSKIAMVLDQLSKSILSLREQLARLEADVEGVRPQMVAYRVHVESLPNALREARRSEVALQSAVAGLESRLGRLEARLGEAEPPHQI